MKKIIGSYIFVYGIFFFLSITLQAQDQNQTLFQEIKLDSTVKAHQKEVANLKQNPEELTMPMVPFPLQYIPLWITVMTLVLTVFLAIATYQSFVKVNEAKKIINDAEQEIKRSKKLAESHEKELKKIKSNFLEDVGQIKKIQEELTNQKAYSYISVEILYELLRFHAEQLQNEKFLKRIFIKRAFNQLYSANEKERFTGITTLRDTITNNAAVMEKLEKIYLNDKSEDIKRLATDAIVQINLRQKTNQDERK